MTRAKAAPAPPRPACAACAAPLHGRYCHVCGQDHAAERGIEFLARDAFAEALSLEGRTVHTLRDLFARPGKLLEAYRLGVGDYYFSPFKLFLVMSAAFFVFVTWVDVPIYQWLPYRTNEPLRVTLIENGFELRGAEYRDVFLQPLDRTPTLPALEQALDAAAAKADPTQRRALALYRDYNAAFVGMNDLWNTWLPRLLWLFMPAYALLLKLFFRRRSFAEHALFAIWAHCVAFAVLMGVATVNLTGLAMPVSVLFPIYLGFFTFAAAAFYQQRRWVAALKGLGHLLAYALLVWLPVIVVITLFYAAERTDIWPYMFGYEPLPNGGERLVVPPVEAPVPSPDGKG